eukprot:CAMPEP_0168462762 /NCGR_PEP_ID=MMETSP0228-20121227/54693_1 /TAXON_ID=133427 /ORGANISM="Protoceratium reticulatum, Strain CCCM 535 (=CCMP 1889)" /LENGTH=90 /DNA_ID=CAMNT_0008478169 /DNA_START=1 /DNA_END=273 /DNA_ORIENTATION=-
MFADGHLSSGQASPQAARREAAVAAYAANFAADSEESAPARVKSEEEDSIRQEYSAEQLRQSQDAPLLADGGTVRIVLKPEGLRGWCTMQ